MKRRQMNAIARSLCEYLCSRNNDIAGYWGIGVLCRVSKIEEKKKFSFQIRPAQTLKIGDCEVTDSIIVTEKLMKHKLDSIEGRFSFSEDGRYPNQSERYTCGIAVAVSKNGRTGLYLSHIACRPHNSAVERRRLSGEAASSSLLARLKSVME